MRRFAPLTILLAGGLGAAPEDYVNFVRQIQQDSGVEWDVTVASSGQMLSPEGVGPAGSLFQLWSIHGPTAFEYHLDEEFVSAYTPSASIVIETGDPYPHVPRTRVDQPFNVTIDISGLGGGNGNGNGNGNSRDALHLSHRGYLYPESEHSIDNLDDATPVFTNEYLITDNGEMVFRFPVTSLPGDDLTRVEGQEVFTLSDYAAHSNNGHGNNVDGVDSSNPGRGRGGPNGREDPSGSVDDEKKGAGTIGNSVESALVQIWPIAEAAFTGIDPAGKYSEVPPVGVSLADLYPDSTTRVRVYAGPPASNPEGAQEISNSYVVIEDSIPQNRTVTLEEIESLFETSGSYTLEVLHRTPFGTDILTQFFPLQIDFSIRVRGTLYSGN